MNVALDPICTDLSGKYLTFILGSESYGISVLKIREIISAVHITPVPQMPVYVKGVINLRGKVIPVIDLRLKFSLASADVTESTCIIVVQISCAGREFKQIGLIVDAVEEVTNVPRSDIEQAPDFGGSVQTDYILGMAKVKGVVKSLLDIDHVISVDTLDPLESQTVAA